MFIKNTILLVEDDPRLRKLLKKSLEVADFSVLESGSVKRGAIDAVTRNPDMAIVDQGLPDGNGVELLKEIRTWSDMPVIILSGSNREPEKLAAFNAGADDYISIPFGVDELVARVRAQLRRRLRSSAHADSLKEISHGDITINIAGKMVTKSGQRLRLTPKEYKLLLYLFNNSDCVLTHSQLLTTVWGPSHSEDVHYLRVFMRQLRIKIEDDPDNPLYLQTVNGVGYIFSGSQKCKTSNKPN